MAENRGGYRELFEEDKDMIEAWEWIMGDKLVAILNEAREETIKRMEAEAAKRIEAKAKRVEEETAKRVEAETTKRVEAEITKRMAAETARRVEDELRERTAKRLLQRHMPVSEVAEVTALDIARVKALAEAMGGEMLAVYRLPRIPSGGRTRNEEICPILHLKPIQAYEQERKGKGAEMPKKNTKAGAGGKGRRAAYRDRETPAFGGLMLGLDNVRERLDVERGYKLSSRPREIDCRIIRRPETAGSAETEPLDNAIAHLFKGHNVVELKNPYERLDIDTVWKVISYAAQYKSSRPGKDSVPVRNLTITILRLSRPRGLFADMRQQGYRVEREFPGVYYIHGMVDIAMQIIVGAELEGDEFVPLRVQKRGAAKGDIRKFIRMVESLKASGDSGRQAMAESVLMLSMAENRGGYRELFEEDKDMTEAWEWIMGDKLVAKINEVREEAEKRMEAETKRVEAETTKRVEAEAAKRMEVETKRVEAETAKRVEAETAKRVEAETAKRVEAETAKRVEAETTKRVEAETTRNLKEETVKRLLRKRMPANEVAEIMDLDIARVTELAKAMAV